MDYKISIYLSLGAFILVFIVDYFLINKKKLEIIKNKGVTKKRKKEENQKHWRIRLFNS